MHILSAIIGLFRNVFIPQDRVIFPEDGPDEAKLGQIQMPGSIIAANSRGQVGETYRGSLFASRLGNNLYSSALYRISTPSSAENKLIPNVSATLSNITTNTCIAYLDSSQPTSANTTDTFFVFGEEPSGAVAIVSHVNPAAASAPNISYPIDFRGFGSFCPLPSATLATNFTLLSGSQRNANRINNLGSTAFVGLLGIDGIDLYENYQPDVNSLFLSIASQCYSKANLLYDRNYAYATSAVLINTAAGGAARFFTSKFATTSIQLQVRSTSGSTLTNTQIGNSNITSNQPFFPSADYRKSITGISPDARTRVHICKDATGNSWTYILLSTLDSALDAYYEDLIPPNTAGEALGSTSFNSEVTIEAIVKGPAQADFIPGKHFLVPENNKKTFYINRGNTIEKYDFMDNTVELSEVIQYSGPVHSIISVVDEIIIAESANDPLVIDVNFQVTYSVNNIPRVDYYESSFEAQGFT